MEKKTLWHRVNAMDDPRIIKMMKKYGVASYTVYWALLCELHRNGITKLLKENDPALKKFSERYKSFALNDFINDCVNDFELFKSDGILFWSDLKDGNIYAYSEEYPGI